MPSPFRFLKTCGLAATQTEETLIDPQMAQIRAEREVSCLHPLRNLRYLRAENIVSCLNQ